jgi:hypothetical protein
MRFNHALGCFLAALAVAAPLQEAFATTWIVSGPSRVAVRAWVGGPTLFSLEAGTVVALTGRCTRGLNLDDIADRSPWKQQKMVSTHWCETESLLGSRGWIFGGYLGPQ